MNSYSQNQNRKPFIKILSPKNIASKLKLEKIFFRKLPSDKLLKQELPIIRETQTQRRKEKKIKPIKQIKLNSPMKKSNLSRSEKYLVSTSLLSNDDSKNFDFSYFKNLSYKYSPIISKREIQPVELTDKTMKVYKQNLFINIIKKKRNDIYKDEEIIQKSLKEYQKQIEDDFLNFRKIKGEFNEIQRKENQIYGYYRAMYKRNKNIYQSEKQLNKNLKDFIEKIIKDIFKCKEYASFIHSTFGLPFVLDKIDEKLLIHNEFDSLREQIINLYTDEELEKENDKKNKYLKNSKLFMKHFVMFEDNIIHLLMERNLIVKDIYYLKLDNKKRLQYLVKRKDDYLENNIALKKNANILNNQFLENITKSKNEIYDFMNYIIEFAKMLDITIPRNEEKNQEDDYYKYYKEIESVLRYKENIIDILSNEINVILNSENENDKNLMKNIIEDTKKYNLERLQTIINETNKKKLGLKKIKIIDKFKKKIIIGRKILDYKFINSHKDDDKKIEELYKKNKKGEDDDINIEYCLSEYNDNEI